MPLAPVINEPVPFTLDDNSYLSWKSQVPVELAKLGVRRTIADGFEAKTPPQDKSDAEKAWACLMGSLDPSLRPLFNRTTTAPEFIEVAETLFASKNQARYLAVNKQLTQLKYDGKGVAKHILVVRNLVDTLKLHTNDEWILSSNLLESSNPSTLKSNPCAI